MQNPLDIHSQVEVEELQLGVRKIKFNPRDSKKGRLFMPIWNDNYPLSGFEDVENKVLFTLEVSHTENIGIYVPTGVSHKIISKSKTGVLLVLASAPSDLSDEIEYIV